MKQLRDALLQALANKDPKEARKQILRAHSKATRVAERKELIEKLQEVK